MTAATIRPTTADDIPALQQVLDQTRLFPSEMLPAMLAAAGSDPDRGVWLTCHVDGVAVGLCHAVPEALADGTWNMRALAVLPEQQGRGRGRLLASALEQHLQAKGQRLLIVDTSGTDAFARPRRFYARHGYAEEARIRDFWAAGDDKVTFRKAL